jgi:succinate dehydrogenase assembly factor 2
LDRSLVASTAATESVDKLHLFEFMMRRAFFFPVLRNYAVVPRVAVPRFGLSGPLGRRCYYDDETNKNDDGSSTKRAELSDHERALYDKAKPRVEANRAKHVGMPDLKQTDKDSLKLDPGAERIARSAAATDAGSGQNIMTHEGDDAEIEIYVRKKRLIHRCLQRGWLEVDLLLGTWARNNVMSLSLDELNEFEDFVNSETIDIYNIMTLRVDALPVKWQKGMRDGSITGIVERIQEWVKTNPLGKADPEKYKEVKQSAKLI